MGSVRVGEVGKSVGEFTRFISDGNFKNVAEAIIDAPNRTQFDVAIRNAKKAFEDAAAPLTPDRQTVLWGKMLSALVDLSDEDEKFGIIRDPFTRTGVKEFTLYIYVKLGEAMLAHKRLLRPEDTPAN